jgi:hypothetical protein
LTPDRGLGSLSRALTAGLALTAAVVATFALGPFDAAARPDDHAPPSNSGVRFTDVATAAGVAFLHVDDVAPFGMVSSGVAWGDFDADGDEDLYLTDMDRPNRLYRNDGDGTFTDVAEAFGVTDGIGLHCASVWGDYDGDGDLDLYLGNDLRDGNRLYRNDGERFVEVAEEAGLFERSQTTAAAWGDFDSDGWLDLYVVNYAVCWDPTCGVEGARDHVYHNRGDGTFENWSDSLGITTTMGGGFQATWTDYDNDGDLDIYVVNDTRAFEYEFGRHNYLFRNDDRPGPGGWQFTEVSRQVGAGLAINGMGLGVGDLDNDSYMDFWMSNSSSSALLHNQRNGTFRNIATLTGTDYTPNFSWATSFLDVNNDGWEDLFIAAGSPYDIHPNTIFLNRGGLQFTDIGKEAGVNNAADQRSASYADYDGDGDLDLYVQTYKGYGQLFRNDTPAEASGHWLKVVLRGRGPNTSGIGARVHVLTPDGRRQTREVRVGSGLGGNDQIAPHFGLGRNPSVTAIEVEWTDGTVQKLPGQPANRTVVVEQTGEREPRGIFLPVLSNRR